MSKICRLRGWTSAANHNGAGFELRSPATSRTLLGTGALEFGMRSWGYDITLRPEQSIPFVIGKVEVSTEPFK